MLNRCIVTGILVVVLGLCGHAAAAFTDFEDLTPGTEYRGEDTFTSGGLAFRVSSEGLDWQHVIVYGVPDSILGSTDVLNGNAWLEIVLDEPVGEVSFRAGLFDRDSYVKVNGVTRQFSLLSELDNTTIGDVDASVSDLSLHLGSELATVTLTGTIESLSIFGREMFIDDVSVIPEPATLSLAALGALAALRRRRYG